MQDALRKFVFTLFLLTIIITATGYGLFRYILPGYYFSLFPAVPLFLLTVTTTVHIYLVRASNNDPRKFTARYLGAMGLKIFIYIIFLVIILALDTEHAIPFLVSFLICYAVFTIIEIISILKFLKRP